MANTSITRRLTTAFALVMTAVLFSGGVAIYAGERFSLDRGLRRDLARQSDELHQLVKRPGQISATALEDRRDSYEQVLTVDGTIVAASPPLQDRLFLTRQQLQQARTGSHVFERGSITTRNRHTFRISTLAVRDDSGPRIIVSAIRRDSRDEALRELVGQLLGIGAIALAITIAVGYRLTRAAVAPVEQLREQADRLYHHESADRLTVPDTRDELASLATTLNELLDRIDATVQRERSFAADASHELRTPLSALKAEIDLALRRPRSVEELAHALQQARGDVERLTNLADELLLVLRTPASELPLQRFAIVPLVKLAVAAAKGEWLHDLQFAAPSDELFVNGSSVLIRRAVDNLLMNALRHGTGAITVSVVTDHQTVRIHVVDQGPGFPDEFIGKAFDRFAQADPSRTGTGSGLGLAIVKTIAIAHDGTVGASNTPTGADVWIGLPSAH